MYLDAELSEWISLRASAVLMRSELGLYRTTSTMSQPVSEQQSLTELHQTRHRRALTHTIFLVTPPHVHVDITSPSVVRRVQRGDLGQERPRILGEWVEEHQVDDLA